MKSVSKYNLIFIGLMLVFAGCNKPAFTPTLNTEGKIFVDSDSGMTLPIGTIPKTFSTDEQPGTPAGKSEINSLAKSFRTVKTFVNEYSEPMKLEITFKLEVADKKFEVIQFSNELIADSVFKFKAYDTNNKYELNSSCTMKHCEKAVFNLKNISSGESVTINYHLSYEYLIAENVETLEPSIKNNPLIQQALEYKLTVQRHTSEIPRYRNYELIVIEPLPVSPDFKEIENPQNPEERFTESPANITDTTELSPLEFESSTPVVSTDNSEVTPTPTPAPKLESNQSEDKSTFESQPEPSKVDTNESSTAKNTKPLETVSQAKEQSQDAALNEPEQESQTTPQAKEDKSLVDSEATTSADNNSKSNEPKPPQKSQSQTQAKTNSDTTLRPMNASLDNFSGDNSGESQISAGAIAMKVDYNNGPIDEYEVIAKRPSQPVDEYQVIAKRPKQPVVPKDDTDKTQTDISNEPDMENGTPSIQSPAPEETEISSNPTPPQTQSPTETSNNIPYNLRLTPYPHEAYGFIPPKPLLVGKVVPREPQLLQAAFAITPASLQADPYEPSFRLTVIAEEFIKQKIRVPEHACNFFVQSVMVLSGYNIKKNREAKIFNNHFEAKTTSDQALLQWQFKEFDSRPGKKGLSNGSKYNLKKSRKEELESYVQGLQESHYSIIIQELGATSSHVKFIARDQDKIVTYDSSHLERPPGKDATKPLIYMEPSLIRVFAIPGLIR